MIKDYDQFTYEYFTITKNNVNIIKFDQVA